MTAFSVSVYPDTSFDSNTMGRDYLAAAAAAAALPTFLQELTFAYESRGPWERRTRGGSAHDLTMRPDVGSPRNRFRAARPRHPLCDAPAQPSYLEGAPKLAPHNTRAILRDNDVPPSPSFACVVHHRLVRLDRLPGQFIPRCQRRPLDLTELNLNGPHTIKPDPSCADLCLDELDAS